jgi:transcriptional regulator with XRE-family HTH domain
MSSNIGEYIEQLRIEKGLTQRYLAELSGISNTEISRIEAGKRICPSPAILRALSKALNIEYSELMKTAGYIEEVTQNDSFYELVFKDVDGKIVDIKRGVKEMFRRDEEWANMAFRASRELSEDDKELLKDMVTKMLERRKKAK